MSKSAQKILKTAEQLFNQQSFSAVGVDLIRDESGCSKTTLYTYFKNKHQLVYSVLQARDERFRQSLLSSVQELDGIKALEKIYDWHINWFQADHFKGCLFVRAVSESNAEDTDILAISQAHKQWIRDLIQNKTTHLPQQQEISALFYLQLEGLISTVLIDGFNAQMCNQQKALIFQLIDLLIAQPSK
ncbi:MULTISPECIES: TetR/AcrR family transcriptional regulator [Acinetobacter]|jgi:AcrR family transcriptional regulator|uniref:TetR family transcriptional regulator n=1 Tax=Acinetobacter chengduensis TaxID=2420890 RepID=A0ABX9U113_9GAMM|nr:MULTISPECIES: TetR/AcrR family transcriptional regulator [Acinetobacter]MBI1451111.1 TetR/AcrR family transcriptional regulator [Acinetobacter sp. FL51]RKG43583.1 TetR/AcrR family transcriptional regulator [Acinetobacter sp. WCHAc060007]RLL24014.1 TetR family transcriptional regulator [Acinetobacter chengduensis]